ncbi:hypothetical protein JQC72_14815 [Polycladomyces sp. WAk]|uniref:Uncharacterized protein n=1 Tax=Polycladomyces zharkentensis TaxID=2807616 RepID=A0ABS2WNB3_9BACL|nr:hypothetical protein [Polycladomyces sp. WAk]MBN2910770.1 hypothetical protein [Polycladomyces sp. WAk]
MMLKIQLRLHGETKTYCQDFISGYLFRRALDLDDKRNKFLKKLLDQENGQDMTQEQEELLNELYHFVSEVFGGQFTPEEYERGTDAREIIDQSWAIVHGIINQVMEPLKELDDDEDVKKKKRPKPNRRK